MSDRRYSEAEVRAIFELATKHRSAGQTAVPASQGLTLADIQEIGQEVGLTADDLARAADAVEARGLRTPRRTSLGMPIGVGRTVPLPRTMTDHEWDQLVAELRATFRARGKVVVQGGLREWSNGNLHALIEPSASGYRLRMGTLKSDAVGWNGLGIAGVVGGAVSLVAALMTGGLADIAAAPAVLGATGLTALISNALRLPRWAREREQQMDHIAARIIAIMKSPDEK